jgi:hypothetical protein
MDTNQIKRFAIEARNKLKEGVAMKMASLGFTKKGDVAENMRPTLVQGGSLWKGQIQTETFFHQWMSLYARIQDKGMNVVYEEAAYTWFNRLVAIRILQKNGLAEPILDFADEARTPRIVDEARGGRIPQMTEEERKHLMELLDDDTKTTEQFALLITAWCHQNPIIEKCFGTIADYTELLLPNNILAEGGFLDMLNHTEFITDDDFRSPELIGWLYQFYISERKDEVFAKKGKFSADEIPAATQIFTPNWIVKYMVENSLGKLWLLNHPTSSLKEHMRYYIDNTEENETFVKVSRPEELTFLDPCCGSGHTLTYAFDLLTRIYEEQGYTKSEIPSFILEHNLFGCDIDKRASVLANFALTMKARQYHERFFRRNIQPNIIELEEYGDAFTGIKNYGSLLKPNPKEAFEQGVFASSSKEYELQKKILGSQFHCVVTNPPYMGGKGMNAQLSDFVKANYPDSKSDLFAVFMERGLELTCKHGYMAMITMQS